MDENEQEIKQQEPEEKIQEKFTNYDTLVLSGGAIKALILLGTIQCAMDNLLLKDVVNYVGSSAGSMINYLLAIGYTPTEIIVYICTHRILERMQSFNLVAMINNEGAVSYAPMQETLENLTLEKVGKYLTMKELYETYGKKLICATYNKTRQMMEYIGPDNYPDLPCLIALRMSANIPMLFGKFRYMGFEFVDAGIADNFPILAGEEIGEKILGLALVPEVSDEPDEPDKGFLEELFSLMYVPINQSTDFRISLITQKSTVKRITHSGKLKFFDFNIRSSVKLDMFSDGYQQLKTHLSGKQLEKTKNVFLFS